LALALIALTQCGTEAAHGKDDESCKATQMVQRTKTSQPLAAPKRNSLI